MLKTLFFKGLLCELFFILAKKLITKKQVGPEGSLLLKRYLSACTTVNSGSGAIVSSQSGFLGGSSCEEIRDKVLWDKQNDVVVVFTIQRRHLFADLTISGGNYEERRAWCRIMKTTVFDSMLLVQWLYCSVPSLYVSMLNTFMSFRSSNSCLSRT